MYHISAYTVKLGNDGETVQKLIKYNVNLVLWIHHYSLNTNFQGFCCLSMKFNVHFGAISNTCNTLQLCDHCPQILRIVQTAIFIKPSKSDANKNS